MQQCFGTSVLPSRQGLNLHADFGSLHPSPKMRLVPYIELPGYKLFRCSMRSLDWKNAFSLPKPPEGQKPFRSKKGAEKHTLM